MNNFTITRNESGALIISAGNLLLKLTEVALQAEGGQKSMLGILIEDLDTTHKDNRDAGSGTHGIMIDIEPSAAGMAHHARLNRYNSTRAQRDALLRQCAQEPLLVTVHGPGWNEPPLPGPLYRR